MPTTQTTTADLSKRGVRRGSGMENNRLERADRPAHEWYRFVLSYPPHLVRDYLQRFDLGRRARVLDPFCGTGTTVVECKRLGLASVCIEGPQCYPIHKSLI